MRKPSPSTFAGVAIMATTIAVLPLTSASAAFNDGDYALDESCGIEATLKVRGNGNGLSVEASTSMALVKDADGATVISFGDADTADDNVVYTLTPGESSDIACATDLATDDEVAELLGLSADTTADAYAAELSVDEASDASAEDADEASAEGEKEEKVVLCHNVESNPHQIEVGASAAESHLEHGDLEGECPEDLVSKKDEKAADREAAKAERDAAKAERDAAKAERQGGPSDATDEDLN